MGGNALMATHGFQTRRIQADEYHREIVPAVLKGLRQLFPGSQMQAVRSYATKPDFGDLDVLIDTAGFGSNWTGAVLNHFKPQAYAWSGRLPDTMEGLKPEGNAFSIEFRGFQVDLLPTRPEEFTWSTRYYAFNDLGNLIGRIAHKMGLKLGHDGLWYVLYNPLSPTHVFSEILVAQYDWDRMLTLCGYDPAVYAAGFETKEDIFRYVVSSPYFNPAIFQLENRNHRSRTRDRKRTTYREFLEWIDGRPGLPQFAWNDDKAVYLPTIDAAFPLFDQQRREQFALRDQLVRVKSRFNGEAVSKATGLAGKDLSMHMSELRMLFPNPQAFGDFVVGATDEQLYRFIATGEVSA